MTGTAPQRYETLEGAVPVFYSPGSETPAKDVKRYLDAGIAVLPEVLNVETPRLKALLVASGDWTTAPRENETPYPPGLPYFTRTTEPSTLVLPEELSPAIQPRTETTLPLAVWHELAHAFILQRPIVKAPAWLREFVPQAASAAVAKREGLPLEAHLKRIDARPGFGVREFGGVASARDQMRFQNLLLLLALAALEEFGDSFLKRLVHELWDETDVVNEERAEELLAGSLGSGGRKWLETREEF